MEYYSAIKKEHIWVNSSEVDEPGVCHTGWRKWERENQIYSNAHIWTLEKWYWWTYLQGRNGEADAKHFLKEVINVITKWLKC